MTDALAVTPRRFAKACPACDGALAGSADLLCPSCWRRLPRPLVELYRLVWRLNQAELAATDGIKELAQLLVHEARRLVDGRLRQGVPEAHGASAPPRASQPRQRKSPVRDAVLALLPGSEADAMTIDEVVAKTRLDRGGVKTALRHLIKAGTVQAQTRRRHRGSGRRPIEHWRAA